MKAKSIKTLGLIFCLLLSANNVFAQPANADPFNMWEYSDNPAMWAFYPDLIGMEIKEETNIFTLSGDEGYFDFSFLYGLPGLYFRYDDKKLDSSWKLGTSLSFGKVLGLGFGYKNINNKVTNAVSEFENFGISLRPNAYLSMMFNTDFQLGVDKSETYSMGLAIRPFAYNKKLENIFSIGADATIKPYDSTSPFVFESIYARFSAASNASLNAFYNFNDNSVGLGLSLYANSFETNANAKADFDEAVGTYQVALSTGLSVAKTNIEKPLISGKSVLVVEDIDSIISQPIFDGIEISETSANKIWIEAAIKTIIEAANDKNIYALAFVDIPTIEGFADPQALSRAIKLFKDKGKKIFVFAKDISITSYAFVASFADYIAIDPNGSLSIVDLASGNIYLKNFLAKYGIETVNYRSHDTKTANNMYSEDHMTDAERDMINRYISGLSSQLKLAIKNNRGDKISNIDDVLSRGPFLNPEKALEEKLIDAIEYEEEFLDKVSKITETSIFNSFYTYMQKKDISWGANTINLVPVVYLSGNIINGKGNAGVSIGESAAELLAGFANNPFVKAVILRVNSGGGVVITSDHIAQQVKKLSDAGIPVYVSMGTYAASGGYYISTCADKIFAEEGTLTGSIGVVAMSINFSKALEKLDIGTGVVSIGESGTFGSPLFPIKERDSDIYRDFIKYTYDRFVKIVAENRNMSIEDVDKIAKGQIWLGSEAKVNGLVDEIGGLYETKEALKKDLGVMLNFVDYMPGEYSIDLGTLFENSSLLKITPFNFETKSLALAEPLDELTKYLNQMIEFGNSPLYIEPEFMSIK